MSHNVEEAPWKKKVGHLLSKEVYIFSFFKFKYSHNMALTQQKLIHDMIKILMYVLYNKKEIYTPKI